MSKARFKNILRSKLTYIFLLAVVFGLISISALRSNYMNMVELRNAVNTADKENGDVEKALQDLRSHVYSHRSEEHTSELQSL